ncbi:MAG: 4-hydroxy-3-polyprenylbenzoate decarboxylase, partial [Pseudohongiellaceae bacterium]
RVRVVPAMPAFYDKPQSIEDIIAFVVDRALDAAGLDYPLRHTWRGSHGSEGDSP